MVAQVLFAGLSLRVAGAFRKDSDPPADLRRLRVRDAVHREAASARRQDRGQDAHGRGLAGAVRAEDAEHLTGLHRDREVVQGDERAVLLGHAVRLDGRRHCDPVKGQEGAGGRDDQSQLLPAPCMPQHIRRSLAVELGIRPEEPGLRRLVAVGADEQPGGLVALTKAHLRAIARRAVPSDPAGNHLRVVHAPDVGRLPLSEVLPHEARDLGDRQPYRLGAQMLLDAWLAHAATRSAAPRSDRAVPRGARGSSRRRARRRVRPRRRRPARTGCSGSASRRIR